jgi:hypothetical protein
MDENWGNTGMDLGNISSSISEDESGYVQCFFVSPLELGTFVVVRASHFEIEGS